MTQFEKNTAIYDLVGYPINGFAAVQLNNRWGIVNVVGEAICDIVYEDVKLSEGATPMVKRFGQFIKLTKGNRLKTNDIQYDPLVGLFA